MFIHLFIHLSVIAARPSSIPYLSALLPSELELQTLEETDSSEQDDQTDTENNPSHIIQASLKLFPCQNVCFMQENVCFSVFFYDIFYCNVLYTYK